MDSLCHLWITTTNLSYRFPILKLPPPPCAVLLEYVQHIAALPKNTHTHTKTRKLWTFCLRISNLAHKEFGLSFIVDWAADCQSSNLCSDWWHKTKMQLLGSQGALATSCDGTRSTLVVILADELLIIQAACISLQWHDCQQPTWRVGLASGSKQMTSTTWTQRQNVAKFNFIKVSTIFLPSDSTTIKPALACTWYQAGRSSPRFQIDPNSLKRLPLVVPFVKRLVQYAFPGWPRNRTGSWKPAPTGNET